MTKNNFMANISTDATRKKLLTYLGEEDKLNFFLRSTAQQIEKSNTLKVASNNNPASLINAMLNIAYQGLVPDGNQACLVPFDGVVTDQVMKNGLILLGRRSGFYSDIIADIVRENDTIEMQKGSSPKFSHSFGIGNRGRPVAYYCYTKSAGGEIDFTIMGIEELEIFKQDHGKTSKGMKKIWLKHPEEMCLKTVIKRHLSRKPTCSSMSFEMARQNTMEFTEIPQPSYRGLEEVETVQKIPAPVVSKPITPASKEGKKTVNKPAPAVNKPAPIGEKPPLEGDGQTIPF